MVDRSKQIKNYRLKKSWKNTFYFFGVLLLIAIISIAIGFFSGLTHLESTLDQDFDNIVYAYDDKVDYLFTQTDFTNDNIIRWRSEIDVKIDVISLIVTTQLNRDDIIQLMNDIEYDIMQLKQINHFEVVDIESLNMYNIRLNDGVTKYNQDVMIYNKAVDSNYGGWFKQLNPNISKTSILDLNFNNI